MTHPTEAELDALDAKLASQIGDDISVIFNHEYLFKQSRAAIADLRAQLASATYGRDVAEACNRGLVRLNEATQDRADRAEAALAKAVDALEYYAVEALPWEADDSLRARTTLAEIKGESHD